MHQDQIKDIDNRFTYHQPDAMMVADFEAVRRIAKDFALHVSATRMGNRERALTLTKIEEAVFWANAGIARYTEPVPKQTKTDIETREPIAAQPTD